MADLNDLYRWFDENRDKIINGHGKEYALLRNKAVISYFNDEGKALEYARKADFLMGEFLIQECVSKDEECMYYHNEAVSFG